MGDYVFPSVDQVGSASEIITQMMQYAIGSQKDKLDVLMRYLMTIQEGLVLVFVE